jgi:transcriptional regulator GlxA family with amidase domain
MKAFVIFLLMILSFPLISVEGKATKKVGIIVYDGVYLLDFAGPLEIFFDTFLDDTTKGFEVYLIAPDSNNISAHTGTFIKPDFSIDNAPLLDILVIPGGNLNLTKQYPKVAEFIKKSIENSEITMSVCTGAFILADLGILDNLEATTWYGAKSRLQKIYPKIKISDERFTDNGKIITTAGVSAGVDGALHVVEKIYGKEISERTAKYIEWK